MANKTKILLSDAVAARALHECLDEECLKALKNAGLIACVDGYAASVKAQLATDLSILDEVRGILSAALVCHVPADELHSALRKIEDLTREELV